MPLRVTMPFVLTCVCALVGQAPKASPKAADPAPEQLIQEIGARSELMKNLEELCDEIGPRLTGSKQLRRAQAWAMDKLRAYGAVNVHEEAYDLGRPWHRGVARAKLLNANGIDLNVVQMGWTEGTRGVVRGDVALLNVNTLAEFKAVAPKLAGKVVLVLSRPRATEDEAKDRKTYLAELWKTCREAKVALVLIPSEKGYGLHEMGGSPTSAYQRRAAFISREHANLLKRLLARGITPRVEAELTGGFGVKPTVAHNVVADFPGTEQADELVIVGAHLDSWDLATGATDNGTGTVVALEVLRALKASGFKPKRTLRVVLFSGEEQGLLGSKAYLASHAAELAKVQAVLIDDAGSGRMTGFPDMETEAWDAPLAAAMAPAERLGAVEMPYAVIQGSDQDTFFEGGLPAFAPVQDPLDYRTHTHHSQADSPDHVVKDDLIQGAQVMAVTAWGLLNGARLPHRPSIAP